MSLKSTLKAQAMAHAHAILSSVARAPSVDEIRDLGKWARSLQGAHEWKRVGVRKVQCFHCGAEADQRSNYEARRDCGRF